MSYTIDVYRGRLRALSNYPEFLLFITFFPQLVAGPIVRAVEFVPQLPRVRRPHLQVINEGLFLMAGGFFLKMVCADNAAVFVNRRWSEGYRDAADAGGLIWLVLLFSAQIFCDFAGYSNIARGVSLTLGFRLPVNFNAPYIAGSFQNFWERWHITLSSWLRDYLYVPLGGNRRGRLRTYVNLLTVMVLGGLWHGAALTFVAWGALHGGALAIERALGLQQRGRARPFAVRIAWGVAVQIVVLVTWIFFRSEGIANALQFCRNIAALQFTAPTPEMWLGSTFLLPVVLLHLWHFLEERGTVAPIGPKGKAVLTGVFVFLVATCYGPTNAFIYFQF
jgi:alginate O-acetyltransferase complex protein AlgI